MVSAEIYRPKGVEVPKVKMPLSTVPEAKGRSGSSELVSIASHELNHALTAWGHGVPIVSISVEPAGNSLGRTIIGGYVSREMLKIIAAGGGVDTHDGCAQGYGSDKYKVDVMYHFHGGQSWESAKQKAAGSVFLYSKEVRQKAAEIIAHLRHVPGYLLPEIMLRAQMEVDQEKGMVVEPESYILTPTSQKEFKDHTVIDTLPGNMLRITYVIVGEKKKEEYVCGICQGINGHEEKCPKANSKKDSDSKEESSSKEPLPIKGEIFSSVVLKSLRLSV